MFTRNNALRLLVSVTTATLAVVWAHGNNKAQNKTSKVTPAPSTAEPPEADNDSGLTTIETAAIGAAVTGIGVIVACIIKCAKGSISRCVTRARNNLRARPTGSNSNENATVNDTRAEEIVDDILEEISSALEDEKKSGSGKSTQDIIVTVPQGALDQGKVIITLSRAFVAAVQEQSGEKMEGYSMNPAGEAVRKVSVGDDMAKNAKLQCNLPVTLDIGVVAAKGASSSKDSESQKSVKALKDATSSKDPGVFSNVAVVVQGADIEHFGTGKPQELATSSAI